MKITNGNLYLPDYHFHTGTIEIENEYISLVSAENHIMSNSSNLEPDNILDAGGCYVLPGLIDIQLHGCMGADVCDATPEALHTITAYQASQGITGICTASMTLPEQKLIPIMENAAAYSNTLPCADLLGIRLEGPFLSEAKCGAQNSAYLQKADLTLFETLQEKANGLIRIVDVAPEADTDCQFMQTVSEQCKVSLAHTAADYSTCQKAFTAGASHVTHLFNAMNEFHHRKPGLIGAAYDTPACTVELICDGIHVDAATIRMAFQLFTDARIVLISDSMRATGMPDGSYTLGGQTVKVCGNLATLNRACTLDSANSSNETLAGSVTHLMDCVRKAVSFGIPLESAIRCATATPSHCIGIADKYGYLRPGHIANIVILNPDLSLRHVIIHGRLIL